MNGFSEELLNRVLGVNGHATVVAGPAGLADYDGLTRKLAATPGVTMAMPMSRVR